MAKKVPTIQPSRATRPRNAFDLSQRHLFTAHAGMLLPIMNMHLIPHDHVEINAEDFMRTLPMNSAAYVSMRGVYEFFFVPYSQLWHQFDQFITGMNDYKSSFHYDQYQSDAPVYLPSVNLSDLHSYLNRVSLKDIHGYKMSQNAVRLLDLLGYGRIYKTQTDDKGQVEDFIFDSQKLVNRKVTPFNICAYNKIYNDYYRHSTYENVDINSFNFDMLSSNIDADTFCSAFLRFHYRNAQTDYLTNLRPTPLFTERYFQESGSIINGNHFSLKGGDSQYYAGKNAVSFSMSSADNDNTLNKISVADIRNAFALDKLLRVTQQAGKTYAEQIKAHFGYEVSEGRDGKVHYLGGFDSNIQIGDVTQQSGTTVTNDKEFGGYLGRVVGKATGSGRGHIEYDAREHGILMCIYSLVPDMQYDATRVDAFNMKNTRGDFFIPEFENLGMQPLDMVTVNQLYHGVPFGWQPRYSEYKTALDVNHGQFIENQPLSYWCTSRARRNDSLSKFDISALKINPSWLDDIFAVDYNGNENTDCVQGGCYFNVMKVSDMSESGEPSV